jgi:hypothetical protein
MGEKGLSRFLGRSSALAGAGGNLRFRFGSDTRSLQRFPLSVHNVHANWTDAAGREHEAVALDEIANAYAERLTGSISFTGFRGDGRPCHLVFRPGAVPPIARVEVQGSGEQVQDALAPCRTGSHISVRWSSSLEWGERQGDRGEACEHLAVSGGLRL